MRRLATLAALATALTTSALPTHDAHAAIYPRLSLGANYWFNQRAIFDAMLAFDVPISGTLVVGARAGGLVISGPARGGIPIDLLVRFNVVRPLFLEILGGPWLLFDTGETLHPHLGVGIGAHAGHVGVSFEFGYLDPDALMGLNIVIRF